ncbi:hypothetical protein DPMN_039276 [Dreissena polymorpha]|uniref:Uncharacterized protein n=1 Tax=Dreissena polymorpha TaxID=45954 RepID=A0A9D4KRG5_DREPO|nr:hypothetical protein DPMN_086749 [Dreissena polymorpha]KAH3875996.1 hypothetical protein DPMN_039276 [Dreissena polymorpha]
MVLNVCQFGDPGWARTTTPSRWPTITCGGGTGFREAAPTIKTGGVLWLTCWTVVCDLAEARWEHAQRDEAPSK